MRRSTSPIRLDRLGASGERIALFGVTAGSGQRMHTKILRSTAVRKLPTPSDVPSSDLTHLDTEEALAPRNTVTQNAT
jgi:hypothetical protein